MSMKNILLGLGAIISIAATSDAHAIQVNTMLATLDAQGDKPAFTVKNNDGATLFVRTEIAEVTVENNKIVETPYTNENLADWKLNTTPSKIMLLNGQSKDIYADDLCGDRCDKRHDSVYRVSFIPQPYIDPEGKQQNTVSLLIGFAPLLVKPAEDPVIDYEYERDDESKTVRFNNKGTTLLYFSINTCTPAKLREGKQCEVSYPVLAGRDRNFTIPDEIFNDAQKITVVNHDETYIKTDLL